MDGDGSLRWVRDELGVLADWVGGDEPPENLDLQLRAMVRGVDAARQQLADVAADLAAIVAQGGTAVPDGIAAAVEALRRVSEEGDDPPPVDAWGVYHFACARCGCPIVRVARVASVERGEAEGMDGEPICRVCRSAREISPN